MERKAVITRSSIGGPTAEVVAQYLPYNYRVSNVTSTEVTITGEDDAGWTLDGYVIPRLASGLIHAREHIPDCPTVGGSDSACGCGDL